MQSITASRSLPEAAPFIANVSTYLSNWMTHRGHVTITARKSFMRRVVSVLAVAAICSSALSAQEGSTPQTARQALLEMFFSKTPGTFVSTFRP